MHLLTREAFLIYGRHLKSNGIIAVHISNRSMDLGRWSPILRRDLNYQTVTVEHLAPPGQWWIGNSIWMLLSRGSKQSRFSRHSRGGPPNANRLGEDPVVDG